MGNHNSGRRPDPTKLRILKGNPGKRPFNDREPRPPIGDVTVPGTISRDGAVVWARLAPVAIAMGVLTLADVEAFATLCELQASLDLVARAKDAADFAPFVTVEDGDGPPTTAVHAALALQIKLAPIVRPYYERFGLEPSSRSRLTVGPGEAAPSKWAGLAGG